MTDFEGLLRALTSPVVDFILVGGVAARAHGSARLTQDLDVVYSRAPDNVARLVAALEPLEAYLRGAPPGLPFVLDVATVTRGRNCTLTTRLGDLDLLGEITGGGRHEDLLPGTLELSLFGLRCRCLSLESLIHVKRAAGRPRDLEAIAELEALREERDR